MLNITFLSLAIAAISAAVCGIVYGIKVLKSKKNKTEKPRPDFCAGVPAIVLFVVFAITMMVSAIACADAETKVVSETKYEIAMDEDGNPIIANYIEASTSWCLSKETPVEPMKARIDVLDNSTKTFKTLNLSDRDNIKFTESSGAYYVIQKTEYKNIWMTRFAIVQSDDECFVYLPESAIKHIGKQTYSE